MFGRVRRSVEAADAATQASIENRNDMLVTLLVEVARNYIELQSAQQRQAITTENLHSQREVLDFTKGRQESGIGDDLDVSNAAAQVAWCLMTNHIHLLLAADDQEGIGLLMKCLSGRQTRYQNRLEGRSGTL